MEPIRKPKEPFVEDAKPEEFFALLHAFLRSKTADEEQENNRARACCTKWLMLHIGPFAEVCTREQNEVVAMVIEHFHQIKQAPSLQTLKDMASAAKKPGLLDLLKEYEEYRNLGELRQVDPIECQALFTKRVDGWMAQRFSEVTRRAITIAEHGDYDGDVRRIGVRQAMSYLTKELSAKVFHPEVETLSGDLQELAPLVGTLYDKIKQDLNDDNLVIPTGIEFIDQAIGGYRKKTLNLILGRTGHRKTCIARTIAYTAATSGFRVLYIPLEWSVEEELANFAMIHAHNTKCFVGTTRMRLSHFQNAKLTQEEETFVKTVLIPQMQTAAPSLVLAGASNRTWPGIRAVIEAKDADQKLDLVVIDYIGLFDLSGARGDSVLLMHQWIKEVKQMALYHDNRGLTIVSPVQGNRKGYEEAEKHDGDWDTTGIDRYGEFEKSADTVMYCFQPDNTNEQDQVKLGFCKIRRDKKISPKYVDVNPYSQLVGVKTAPPEDSTKTIADDPHRYRNTSAPSRVPAPKRPPNG